jgi:hypothetical protein
MRKNFAPGHPGASFFCEPSSYTKCTGWKGGGEELGVIKLITWHHQTQVKSPGRAKKLLDPRKDPLVPTPNQY